MMLLGGFLNWAVLVVLVLQHFLVFAAAQHSAHLFLAL